MKAEDASRAWRREGIQVQALQQDPYPGGLTRSAAGHWEGDTVVSAAGTGTSCLLTLTERKHRLEIIRPIDDRSAASVVRELDIIERQMGSNAFRRLFRSITFDNGSEFSDFFGMESSAITRASRTTLYYAHPYTACERGTNENHNGIIRRFFPKGTAFSEVNDKDVRRMQDWMNQYPRRILGGKSPLFSIRKDIGPLPSFLTPRYGG